MLKIKATGGTVSSKGSKRRDRIQRVVEEQGAVSVGALAEMLDVSMQTIRRDLDVLCDGDVLRRTHGRIELSPDRLNSPLEERKGTNRAGKRSIAELVATLIPDGSTLFLSIGSTPLAVAKALAHRQELTVITNNLGAAMALSDEVSNRILLPGGELRLPDRDFIGEESVDFFTRFRAEYAVFGVAGVAADGGLLDFHPAEVRSRIQMQRNAQTAILVLDQSKFGRIAAAHGGNISDADRVVIDRPPTGKYQGLLDPLEDRVTYSEALDVI